MKSLFHKRALLSLQALILLLAFAQFTYAKPSLKTINRVKRAVARVSTFDASGKPLLIGSGFFVTQDRLVTALHVVKGASRVLVQTFNGCTYSVSGIVAQTSDNDLVVLQTNRPVKEIVPLEVADQFKPEGEPVMVVSPPDDASPATSAGLTRDVWYIKDVGEFILITAQIRKGNSGSPVVNDRGEVIGVAALHMESADNLNFAVPAELVKNLLVQALTAQINMF